MQRMASDKEAIQRSAIQKFAEFARLEYPISVLRGVCTYMAAVTAEYEWIKQSTRMNGFLHGRNSIIGAKYDLQDKFLGNIACV